MKVQAISSHVLYWKNGECTVVTCTGDKLQDAINEWAHGRVLAQRTCGGDVHYQFNGYIWEHRDAVAQRQRNLNAIWSRIASEEEKAHFNRAIDTHRHLRAASIVNIDGQWFIIDVVNDPEDWHDFGVQFSESIAIHAHSYDDQDGEDIVVHWDDLFNGLDDGGMELMRVMPMSL